MLLGTHCCCCCVDEDVRGCCGVGDDRGCCCGRRWEVPSSFASMAATLAFENGDDFDGAAVFGEPLKLGREEEDDVAGADLGCNNAPIPNLRFNVEYQSLRN